MPEEQKEEAPKEVQTEQEKKASKPSTNLPLLLGILVLLLLAGGAYFGWQMWNDQQQANETPPPPPPAPAQPSPPSPTPPSVPMVPSTPSANLRENIEASINTMNTAALEGYMTDPVTVIMAATECCGARTPTQAVADLDYLSGGTDPWDWNLPEATLDGYQSGFYKQYFPENAVVGVSANNYLVSFTVDANDDISTVFMSITDDL